MNFKYKNLTRKLSQETITKFFLESKNIFQKIKNNEDTFFKPIDMVTIQFLTVMLSC